mmetsp:Transcript_292/g.952  ORF Transcript_292/g.952 Transcript_292/m.952 type:complete len:519 (+) Transcript_292:145-1701(+)|eukprot:CAMPEP_0198730132 /NCGR_PEP_ID=MMETSP1475-20131203/22984_1 /TAXON_ID= ORGANISM="Unidentified sp., Strain CCMP1999" /NCGR_SAMPLE_ID=MMETSP1475 /ASSEMBLY_ACC=CAM_ASM_001111 /LENGTH=518 /DNA_ID=CAMNT_0044492903 /DNA_START=46 /DNA_END=1602 /DNA_ORIENTATION=-
MTGGEGNGVKSLEGSGRPPLKQRPYVQPLPQDDNDGEEQPMMARRKSMAYGAMQGNESPAARLPRVRQMNSNPVNDYVMVDKIPSRDHTNRIASVRWGQHSLPHTGGMPNYKQTSQIGQYAEGVRDGLSGLEGYWSTLNYLLVFVPLGILAGFFNMNKVLTFVLNFIGCVPLATILGKATEDLAAHTNDSIGGLLNATFGNAVEIILSIAALQQGLLDVIRYTLVGSVLSNLLLVLGSSFFFGGLIYREQELNVVVAESNADLLVAASFGFALPSVFGMALPEGKHHQHVAEIFSLLTAVCLLAIYGMFLYFQLFTHYESYLEESDEEVGENGAQPEAAEEAVDGIPVAVDEDDDEEEEEEVVASFNVALVILVIDVIFVSICSEYIVGSIEEFSNALGLGRMFVSLIFLPIIGNAVEHFSAVMVAMKDKMDLSIGIACGSSVQIAAFAAPIMVVLSWIMGSHRLTLDVGLFNTICIVMSVFLVNTTMRDSKTNWLEGAILLTSYIMIAAALFLFDKV